MSLQCTRCQGSGFLNFHAASHDLAYEEAIVWIKNHTNHDMSICDCCGNGDDEWHGTPGEHYNPEDPIGRNGPYAYNGGLCECN